MYVLSVGGVVVWRAIWCDVGDAAAAASASASARALLMLMLLLLLAAAAAACALLLLLLLLPRTVFRCSNGHIHAHVLASMQPSKHACAQHTCVHHTHKHTCTRRHFDSRTHSDEQNTSKF